jgi:hypothetical protein
MIGETVAHTSKQQKPRTRVFLAAISLINLELK